MALRPAEKQQLFEIGSEEMWTPVLEEINDLMHEEKAARHENDHIKVSEICTRIVSKRKPLITFDKIWLFDIKRDINKSGIVEIVSRAQGILETQRVLDSPNQEKRTGKEGHH